MDSFFIGYWFHVVRLPPLTDSVFIFVADDSAGIVSKITEYKFIASLSHEYRHRNEINKV